jgi:hypothetical protein
LLSSHKKQYMGLISNLSKLEISRIVLLSPFWILIQIMMIYSTHTNASSLHVGAKKVHPIQPDVPTEITEIYK